MMRLKSLYVKDFRSIDGEVKISLDAPIVLIHGPNGAGKTSILSAIELALTGSVPSLSRAEPDYLSYLPHKDRPCGEVRLEVTSDSGKLRSADLRVTTNAVSGSPLLSDLEAKFFSERSYLAQSTLGRLLEIYQHADKKSDSPLTRFVRELLGLDRMDSIIDGLHSSGNITRLKVPVPAYGEIRDWIPPNEDEVRALTSQRDEAASTIMAKENDLRQRVASIDSALSTVELPELIQRLTAVSEESDLIELGRMRRELQVSYASWTSGLSKGSQVNDRSAIETAHQTVQNAFEQWILGKGQVIEVILDRAADFFADISVSGETSFVERIRVLSARIATDLERVAHVITAHESALQRRDALVRQLSEAQTRLERLDREISTASTANESFARTLSDLALHTEGDICPVCDRDFSETSDTPLLAHVATKVAAMVEQAGRLQSLIQARNSTQVEVARLDREKRAAASGLVSENELTALKVRAADLTDVDRQLAELKPHSEEGDRYRNDANRSAQVLVALQREDQSGLVLRKNTEELARNMGISFDTAVPTEQMLQTLATTIEKRERALTERQTVREGAIEAAQALVALRGTRDELITKLVALEREIEERKAQKAKADKIIELGKELTRQTRDARGRVVRRVFNDELNAVWRDLFVRLAPEEPFIPAFAIPEAANGDVEALLETHHRRGGKGGNPRAMLSAGNLNTAALTLFLALHLSVKPKLPWLVIDDPVQSMDEVHIAQFAALLRTLSKQTQRQVIIAVHERSLFDYLALELSPAFDGDRLNVVELGRNAIGQTTSRWDAHLYVADRAIAV